MPRILDYNGREADRTVTVAMTDPDELEAMLRAPTQVDTDTKVVDAALGSHLPAHRDHGHRSESVNPALSEQGRTRTRVS